MFKFGLDWIEMNSCNIVSSCFIIINFVLVFFNSSDLIRHFVVFFTSVSYYYHFTHSKH